MTTMTKNWDRYVVQAERVARSDGFLHLRERIIALAAPEPEAVVVDVGAGTGLLTLALAPNTKKVWAFDISSAMCEYLRTKAASAGLRNIEVAPASAESLPLVDETADVVVSNYCFHHLDRHGKREALAEAFRVLRPGGRLVFADMMFNVGLTDPRDRAVLAAKLRAMVEKGPAGMLRLAKNGSRYLFGCWEHPSRAEWWQRALEEAGFEEVWLELLLNEGGIAVGTRP